MPFVFRFAAVAAVTTLTLYAQSAAEILDQMDAAARDFKSFSAKVKWVDYTAVLSESSERNGVVRAHKGKAGVSGILEFAQPDPVVKRFGGKTFETYYPKVNTVEIIDVGKHAGAVEQFLLLGFAVRSGEIRKAYDAKVGGSEQVAGFKTTRLELWPKGDETKKLVTKIELWIPEGKGNPVQEKVTKTSKDYSLATYSDLKINPPLADAEFELKLPPDVKKINPK
jgi:outer membrane lipoprotein-sorting protein